MRVILAFAALTVVLNTAAQPALSPSRPALGGATSSLVPSSPALGTTPGPTHGGATTNLTIEDVATAVLNLQLAIEQSLPALAAFNRNFDFTSLPGAPYSVTPGSNFSLNLGVNSGTTVAVNLGRNLAFNPGQGSSAPTVGTPLLPPIATIQTNGLSGDTLRVLLLLQSDMERMLPVLSVLSGTTNATEVVEEAAAAGAANGAPQAE